MAKPKEPGNEKEHYIPRTCGSEDSNRSHFYPRTPSVVAITPSLAVEAEAAPFEMSQIQLSESASTLWRQHVDYALGVKRNRAELRQVRVKLADVLYTLKPFYSKPGCKGEWSAFLEKAGIPRSTADRLVTTHKVTLVPEDSNCPNEAITILAPDAIQQMAKKLGSKLCKILTTPELVEQFLSELSGTLRAQASSRGSEGGGLLQASS